MANKILTSEQKISHFKVGYDENVITITDTDTKQTVSFHVDVMKAALKTYEQNSKVAGNGVEIVNKEAAK